MIIDLPKVVNNQNTNDWFSISDGYLHFSGSNFEKLMYDLTYEIQGRDRCLYCGELLDEDFKNNRPTLDHKVPRYYGGISITNNLIPSCSECNNKKGTMTYSQYIHYLRKCYFFGLDSESDQIEYAIHYKKANQENMNQLKHGKYCLPNSFGVKQLEVKEILYDEEQILSMCSNSSKQNRIKKYYKKYKITPNPILLTRDYHILKGRSILFFALKNNLKSVSVIRLENVIKE